MRSSTLLALAASLCSSSATVLQGFNYGSTRSDGSFQTEADFQALFSTAKAVSSGFTSARLYTMIQGGSSTNEPTQAIAAAIAEDTTLLLGIWCSAGEADVQAELDALQSAITKYGSDFTKLVVGISVGSEDLYRDSPTGIAADSGAGATPDELVSYISLVRSAIANTGLSGVPVGHVDTWTSWVNSSNSAVAAACDWVGVDAYPYFQNTMANSIEDGPGLFNAAMSATQAAVGHKPVWITETGWPVSGSTQNLAVPSIANAKSYWDNVGCANFGVVNTYWFTLQDAAPVTPNPSFGIVGSTLSDTPLFDVSCAGVTPVSSSAATSTAASGGSTATGSSGLSPSQGVGSGNTSGTGTTSPTSNPASTPTSSPTSPTSASNSSPASNTPSTSTSSPTSTTSYPLSPTSSPVSGPASSSVSASGVPRSSANASAIGSGTGSATSGTGSAASSTVSTSGSVATGLLSGSIVGAVVAAMVVGL